MKIMKQKSIESENSKDTSINIADSEVFGKQTLKSILGEYYKKLGKYEKLLITQMESVTIESYLENNLCSDHRNFFW